MESLSKKIKTVLQNSFHACFPSINEDISITHANPKFGHYQCSNALSIFKKHKKSLNLESAQKISQQVIEHVNGTLFEEIQATPQGFITIKVSKTYIENNLLKLYQNNKVHINVDINELKEENENYENVLVDFSSPNIAKEMHVGHLRSTILGDSICRIFEFLKVPTKRINHVGDWGTQFGMIINYIMTKYPNFEKEMPHFDHLTALYQEAKKCFDNDAEFQKKSKELAISLQNNDPTCRMLWSEICKASKKEFEKIYKILNIQIEYMGESTYIDSIPDVLKILQEQNLLTYIDQALCYKSEKYEVPLFLQKSNGGYGYDATDVAAAYYRLKILKMKHIIYVTDNGQKNHFDILFDLLEKTNWLEKDNKLTHVGFGLVLGENNKKFKTRSGTNVKLIELINEGTERAKKDLLERMHSKNETEETYFQDMDIDQLSEILCVGAIKYFDIKQHRNSDYKFSYDSMLNVKGNTGIYILYAYARICSIFRKLEINVDNINKEEMNLTTVYEINLGLHILKFPDVLSFVLKTMLVHKLAEYTYELTTVFTSFYEHCKVLNDPNMNTRILLCDITKSLLHLCLQLMGITPAEKL